jgi:hypothetical protein
VDWFDGSAVPTTDLSPVDITADEEAAIAAGTTAAARRPSLPVTAAAVHDDTRSQHTNQVPLSTQGEAPRRGRPRKRPLTDTDTVPSEAAAVVPTSPPMRGRPPKATTTTPRAPMQGLSTTVNPPTRGRPPSAMKAPMQSSDTDTTVQMPPRRHSVRFSNSIATRDEDTRDGTVCTVTLNNRTALEAEQRIPSLDEDDTDSDQATEPHTSAAS